MTFLSRRFTIANHSFTLLELLVALTILSVVAVSIHLVFSTAISVRRRGELDMHAYQDGRVVISRMARELASCVIPQAVEKMTFSGEEDSLEFLCLTSRRGKVTSRGGRFVELRYYLEHHGDGNALMRREKALVGPSSDEEYYYTLAEKVEGFSFSYFDGETWTDSWQVEEGLPEAVSITVCLRPSEKTLSFKSIVPIPAAKLIAITGEEENL